MNDQPPNAHLAEFDFAKTLSPEMLAELAKIARVDRFCAGETLFREGQLYNHLHWVISGRVTLEMTTGASSPKCILSLGKGDILAWSSVVGDGRMTAGAIAMTDTELVGFDAHKLFTLMEADSEIGYRLMRSIATNLSRRLLATRLQLLDLFNHPQGTDG